MLRTTEDCVRADVQGLVAFGEHCTQAQDQNGVNGERVLEMLLQQEPLQDEPGVGGRNTSCFQNRFSSNYNTSSLHLTR